MMTVEEAKDILRADKFCQTECKNKNCGSCNIDYSTKEWKTAVDMAIEALEKQISKKANMETYCHKHTLMTIKIFYCPSCSSAIFDGYGATMNYCPYCGQKI